MKNEETAWFAVWFFFIYPTSYFLHLAYTEATLLALALGCFWAARQRKWWLVGLLGALAAMTRLPGTTALAAVALEPGREYRLTDRFIAAALARRRSVLLGNLFGINHHLRAIPLLREIFE